MAEWEGYLECWKDMLSRTEDRSQVKDYLRTHEECTKPETTKHLLSIGSGTGEIDHVLVSLLPHLKSYTAVEPDTGPLDTLKRRMEEFSGIEKHYVNRRMETYTGPSYSVDLILMSHVAYYFADSFTQQIRRALTWLNEGGRILLFHNSNAFSKSLVSDFNLRRENCDYILAEDVRSELEDMRVKFTESTIDYTIDVSYPGPTYYGFLSVILNRRATKEETDKALGILREYLIPQTEKVQGHQTLFAIDKTQSD